jgi:CheY-like chemotaxis protein
MKRILVVDDDKASCELLREIFAAQGWEAEIALSPEAALELAARERFDLVVSDFRMKGADGIDVLTAGTPKRVDEVERTCAEAPRLPR